MLLSERETITKVYYVNGVKEIRDAGSYLLCIEEQEEILHAEDGIHIFYNYYMFDPNYRTKMHMWSCKDKCMPNEQQIIDNYKIYKFDYMK